MDMTTKRKLPRTVTSKRNIKYRESGWRVHEFDVWSASGERICHAVALAMSGSLLVWVGDGASARLTEAALGVPSTQGAFATATTLLASDGNEGCCAQGMARRLAAALARPVRVCSGAQFDRFTAPLVERALLTHIKNTTQCLQ